MTEREQIYQNVLKKEVSGAGYLAMLLAMTRDIETENMVKAAYEKKGIRFAVTEVGGQYDEKLRSKITNSVIGACLGERVIEKNSHDIHALLHATEEAKEGILLHTSSITSLILKIAIVREERWISVAMFGESSMHYTTGHERAGLGVMHI